MINFGNAEFEKSVGNLNQLKDNKIPEVVFSGKSNVGKSSLINKLLNRKSLARVSTKPGKTCNINFYNLENIKLVDLPGYGYAKVSFSEKKRWSALVEGYFSLGRNIAVVVQIIDVRHPPSVLDVQMMDFLFENKIPFIIVASKSDKLKKSERLQRETSLEDELKKYESVSKIIFSSSTGEGVDDLKYAISKYCGF